MSQIASKSPMPQHSADEVVSLRNPRSHDKGKRAASVGRKAPTNTAAASIGGAAPKTEKTEKPGQQLRSVSNPRPQRVKASARKDEAAVSKEALDAKQSAGHARIASAREQTRLVGLASPFVIQPVVPAVRPSQLQPQKDTFTKSASVDVLPQSKSAGSVGPKYVILPGNNSDLVREAMQRRTWWSETGEDDVSFNFKWKETGQNIGHDKCNTTPQVKQIVNHVDNHSELCTKTGLFRNLKSLCDQNGMNVFDYVPVTMVVKSISLTQDLTNMRRLYKQMEKNVGNSEEGKPDIYGSKNMWIVKPSCLNRGKGIQIFNTLASIEHYIMSNQPNSKGSSSPTKEQNQGFQTPAHLLKVAQQSGAWIVQKYIERPLLIFGRKFDIRSYCLLVFRPTEMYVPFTSPMLSEKPIALDGQPESAEESGPGKLPKTNILNGGIRSLLTNHRRSKSQQELEVYFYQRAYLRTSSRDFTTENVDDLNVHLTNNAVQKFSDDYGKYEEGNQRSLEQFQAYIEEHHTASNWTVEGNLVPKMKELMCMAILSVYKHLTQRAHKYTFELFGFDFMIDEQLRVYLLEVNTNPCLALSSQILRDLLPDVIEDIIRLCVDPIFPPPPGYSHPSHRPNGFEQIL